MRSELVDRHEQRLPLGHVAMDEIDSLAIQHPRQVIPGRAAVGVRLAVFAQDVVVVVDGLENRVPFVPPGRNLVRVPNCPGVEVEVLPEMGSAIAGAVKPDRKRVFLVHQVAVRVRVVPENAVVVSVLTRQQDRSGRAAQRTAGHVVGERGAVAADQPPQGGHHPWTDHAGPLVVGLNDDDVRPRRPRGIGRHRPGHRHRRQRRHRRHKRPPPGTAPLRHSAQSRHLPGSPLAAHYRAPRRAIAAGGASTRPRRA
jgi:hypothetical protein